MYWLKRNKKTLSFLLLLVLLTLPSIYSLVLPGFFETDDGNWMIIRFSAFYQALSDGQFPARMLGRLNHGYGYPVANFLYPGFMYLATPLQIIGLGFVNSVKLILIFSILGGTISIYFWLNKIFDKKSALIGALFYTYTPYHLYDIYKRGSVGEVLSIGVLPFILWQLERNSLFFTSLGIFLLLISHNTLAILFIILLFLYMAVNVYVTKEKKLFINYSKALLLGGGMSAFFWIPAIYELQYTKFSNILVSDWSKYFADLHLIGASTILVFLVVLILISLKKIAISKHRLTFLFLIVGVVSIFLSSVLSSFFWNYLPSSFIQFPFRLLSVSLISVPFLVACCISVLKGKIKILIFCLLIFFLAISSFSFLTVRLNQENDGFYATNEATTTVLNEYMPKWVIESPTQKYTSKIESQAEIQNLVYNSKLIEFMAKAEKENETVINTIYYPGWSAYINGRKTEILYNNNSGVMTVNIPKGTNTVKLVFQETPLRLLSDLVSILSFALLVFLMRKEFTKYLKR